MQPRNEWSKDKPNILSQANLAKVAEALERGLVFGQHCHYFGGSSLDHVVFRDFDQYRDYILRSTPGDLYYLWSVADLTARGMLLAHGHFASDNGQDVSILSPGEISAVKKYLDVQYNEIVYLIRKSSTLEIGYGDIDQYESFLEHLETRAYTKFDVFVFPLTAIDAPDYYLLVAKYPNKNGEVPVGGAY